jgi:amino acid transporter
MVIAYFMVCTCVWAVLQSLSEMTIAFPVSGNYIDYADRWVDPALAFGAGFAEWLGQYLSQSLSCELRILMRDRLDCYCFCRSRLLSYLGRILVQWLIPFSRFP